MIWSIIVSYPRLPPPPAELVKAFADPVTVRESSLEGNYLEAPNNEELVDPDEGWTIFKSKGAPKRREWAIAKVTRRKTALTPQKRVC